MAAPQQESGHINTSFLTTKLPAWAGVRQNIIGSDLNGRPVPAFLPPHEVQAAAETWGPYSQFQAMPVQHHATAIADAIEDLKTQLMRLSPRLSALEMKIGAATNAGDVNLMELDSGLRALNVRTASLSKKLNGLEERLLVLEEAVDEMEAEDDTEAAPPTDENKTQ